MLRRGIGHTANYLVTTARGFFRTEFVVVHNLYRSMED